MSICPGCLVSAFLSHLGHTRSTAESQFIADQYFSFIHRKSNENKCFCQEIVDTPFPFTENSLKVIHQWIKIQRKTSELKVRKGCKNARKNCKEEKKKQLQNNEKCQMNFRTCKKACEAFYVPNGRMEFGNTLL